MTKEEYNKYIEYKNGYTLFFKVEDCYEAYFNDAVEVSKVLNTPIRKIGDMFCTKISFDDINYSLNTLIKRGIRVAFENMF